MATSNPQDDWARFGIRMPKDLHQQIHHFARKEDRSFNGQLLALIREAINLRQPTGEKQ